MNIVDQVLSNKDYPVTGEQRNFVETVYSLYTQPRNNRKLVVASAVAGAGKTATCIDIYNCIAAERGFFQLVAFNVAAKDELIARGVSPKNCRTLNGLGHANLSRFARSRGLNLVVDVASGRDKISECLQLADRALNGRKPVRRFAKSLVSFCKSHAINKPSNAKLIELASRYELALEVTEEELIDWECDIDELERKAFDWVRKALEINNKIPSTKDWLIDFNDQVYLPVVHKIDCFQNDLLIIDEAQDLSIADKKLIDRCLKSNGLLVLVGDDYQCINAWRGATVESLQRTAKNPKLDVVETPLTLNFRSKRAIIENAKIDCPHIECGAGEGGTVETIKDFDVTKLSGDIAVLSRTRAPLIELATQCLKEGTPFTFRFSLKFVTEFVESVCEDNTLSIRAFLRRLANYKKARTEIYEAQGADQALEALEDTVSIVETIIGKYLITTNTVGDLIREIDKLTERIKKSDGALHLTTMHSSKGLEWDTTYLIGFDEIGKNCHKEWKQIEARNLRLVARTRAKSHLIFVEGSKSGLL